jgi:hypothetical protein
LTQSIFPDLASFLSQAFFAQGLHLGKALDQTGQLSFYNSSSALPTILQAGNATATVTYTLPTAGPAADGYLLASTAAGALSWTKTPSLTSATITTATITTGTITTGLFGDGTVGAPSIAFNSDADGSGTGFYRSAANTISFSTNGVDRMDLDASGNLTFTSSGGSLRCNPSGSDNTPEYSFRGDVNTGMRQTGADALALITGGTEYLTINSSGQVALGTGSAATNVRVNTQTTTGTDTATLTNAPTAGDPVAWIVVNINGTDRKIPVWA